MVDYKLATIQDIMENAKDSKAKTAYLKEEAKKVFETDKGWRRISFMEIKHDYYTKYYPELLPVAKEKKPTIYEMIEEM